MIYLGLITFPAIKTVHTKLELAYLIYFCVAGGQGWINIRTDYLQGVLSLNCRNWVRFRGCSHRHHCAEKTSLATCTKCLLAAFRTFAKVQNAAKATGWGGVVWAAIYCTGRAWSKPDTVRMRIRPRRLRPHLSLAGWEGSAYKAISDWSDTWYALLHVQCRGRQRKTLKRAITLIANRGQRLLKTHYNTLVLQ